jgi:Txe/YoeB family toxin of Txe-Axe toxin-antitoxin module
VESAVNVVERKSNMETLERSIASLSELVEYYQRLYERYLNEAMRAKAQLEKTQELLEDLWSRQTNEFSRMVRSSSDNRADVLEAATEPRRESIKEQENSRAVSTPLGETEDLVRQERLERAIVTLKNILKSEKETTLHKNYLSKRLSEENGEELSESELIGCLEQLSAEGICRQDEYDKNCYRSVFKETDSVKVNPKTLSLPPTSKIETTLTAAIVGVMNRKKDQQLSNQDLIDYLYSEKQQKRWSSVTKEKVSKSISSVLSDKRFLGKKWLRLERGLYLSLGGGISSNTN